MRDLRERLRRMDGARAKGPERPTGAELRERLDRFLGPGRVVTAAELPNSGRSRVPVERYVAGARVETPSGPAFRSEAVLADGWSHGALPVAALGRLPGPGAGRLFPECLGDVAASEEIAFLDTETTGLAGGAGTVAFLVGVARWGPRGFRISQLFLEDLDREPALLEALAAELEGVRCLVTYNGRAFDVPLLENRHVLNRRPWPIPGAAHLDLLHPSRTLWRCREPDCRLSTLERGVLGFERRGDVPGFEIPEIYRDYLRRGASARLAAVFEHNRHDLVSLAGLLWAAGRAADGDGEGGRVGVGLLHARGGRRQEAREALEAGLGEDLPPRFRARALRELSLACKACGDWDRALELWAELRSLAPAGDPFPVEEAAKVLEHRLRRPAEALALIEEALASGFWAAADREALEKRGRRLRAKLEPGPNP